MEFAKLEERLRVFETAHDHCVLPGIFMVARLDGRNFTRLTKVLHPFATPFDERIRDHMIDYFLWRSADAHRNALNGHCYWMLRKLGKGATEAANYLEGLSGADKNELLFSQGINFNDLPNWQKRGVGLSWATFTKEATNPITGEAVVALRHRVKVELDLPMGERYGEFIQEIIRRGQSDR